MIIRNKLPILLIVFTIVAIFVPLNVLGQNSEGLLTGKILDPEGRVIKDIDVRVFAYRKGEWIEGFFIKAEGSYRIQLPVGEWFIGAEVNPESGFTGSEINLPISVNGFAVAQNISLKRLSAIISGKVLKPDGSKFPKALVSLSSLPIHLSTETDSNGVYRFLVPAGRYLLRAFSSPEKGGINPKSETLDLKNGQLANLSLVFKPSDVKIFGQISLFNSPSPALIWAWSDEGGYSEAKADNSGNYQLKVKANEVWHIKAVRELDISPYESRQFDVSVKKEDIELDIELLSPVSKLPKRRIEKFYLSNTDSVSLELSNGVRLSLPPGAVPEGELAINIVPFIGTNQKSVDVVGSAYRINLYDRNNQPIRKLKKSGVLELPYTDNDLKKVNADENNLKVFFWDDNASAWRSNGNSVVVKKDKFLLGLVSHFSEFVVADPEGGGAPPEGGGEGGEGSSASVESSGGGGGGGGSFTPVSPPPPTAPSIINASASQDSVTVTFFDFIVSKNERYKLQRSVEPSNFNDIGEPINASPFVDSYNLKPGMKYYYRIIAQNDFGESLPSPVALVTIPADTEAPSISDGVEVVVQGGRVTFTFTTNEIAKSSVNYSIDSASESSLVNNNFLNLHSLTGPVQPDAIYRYQITVTDEAGNITSSPVETFTSPSLSSTLDASSDGTSQSDEPSPISDNNKLNLKILEDLKNFIFTRTLTIGSTGTDVFNLQRALNSLGYIIANSGPGSSGNETFYFGQLTAEALKMFQKQTISSILIKQGIPNGINIFGPSSIEAMNNILNGSYPGS